MRIHPTRFLAQAAVGVSAALLLVLPGVSRAAWEWEERPSLSFSETIRVNLRDKNRVTDELIERFELAWPREKDSWWRVIPFAEIRHNLEDGVTSRMEFGGEIGLKPLQRWGDPWSWYYLGNGFHQTSEKPGRDHPEWEVRNVLHVPLPWKLPAGTLSLYALDEWTFDLGIGEGVRNEIAAGVKLPLLADPFRLHLKLGWRHVDLIHELDNDQFEGALQAKF